MSVFPLQSSLFDYHPFFPASATDSGSSSVFTMDWKETPEAHIFKFDLPDIPKTGVKLQLHGDRILRVIVERKAEEEEKDGGSFRWHCRERDYGGSGSFYREFRLPENVRVDCIGASMIDGVLVVKVPKDEMKGKAKKSAVRIEISEEGEASFKAKGLGRFVCCKA